MFISIDRNSSISIKKQLYDGLIEMVLSGALVRDEKLTSTRDLARELNIARNSVIEIYEQLVAESYFYSIEGKGTFVSDIINKELVDTGFVVAGDIESRVNPEDIEVSEAFIDFNPGTPDLEHFPAKLWINYLKDYLYGPNKKTVGFSQVKGYLPLRQELVSFLRKHKGIRAREDQVFITSGTSGALNQIALALKSKFNRIVSENLVVDFVPDIFGYHDYTVEGIEIDKKGLLVDELPIREQPHLIYTTPSHQMPLGVILPINRRKALVDYAVKGNHIIIEDDYDSEFRFTGAPVNALKQIGTDCVIYLGTFSKTLGPGLRIGYMVVPNKLLDLFNDYFETIYGVVQVMDQYCLYRLLKEGQYEKHIYKMTKVYKKKSEVLRKAIEKYLSHRVEVIGSLSGLHISLRFKDRTFNHLDHELFEKIGVRIELVTAYLLEESDLKATDIKETDTLIIGFGHLSLEEIEEGIKALSLV